MDRKYNIVYDMKTGKPYQGKYVYETPYGEHIEANYTDGLEDGISIYETKDSKTTEIYQKGKYNSAKLSEHYERKWGEQNWTYEVYEENDVLKNRILSYNEYMTDKKTNLKYMNNEHTHIYADDGYEKECYLDYFIFDEKAPSSHRIRQKEIIKRINDDTISSQNYYYNDNESILIKTYHKRAKLKAYTILMNYSLNSILDIDLTVYYENAEDVACNCQHIKDNLYVVRIYDRLGSEICKKTLTLDEVDFFVDRVKYNCYKDNDGTTDYNLVYEYLNNIEKHLVNQYNDNECICSCSCVGE